MRLQVQVRYGLGCYVYCLCLSSPEVTLALLDAANDKDSLVQEQVRKSILTLGNQQPERVLSMCQDYLVKHPKVSPLNQWSLKNSTFLLTVIILCVLGAHVSC